jgi:hypothetical protein
MSVGRSSSRDRQGRRDRLTLRPWRRVRQYEVPCEGGHDDETNRRHRRQAEAAGPGHLAAQAVTADPLDDLIFSWILDREAELADEVEAGLLMEHELDVVRALLRLILSPNIRMPRARLQ